MKFFSNIKFNQEMMVILIIGIVLLYTTYKNLTYDVPDVPDEVIKEGWNTDRRAKWNTSMVVKNWYGRHANQRNIINTRRGQQNNRRALLWVHRNAWQRRNHLSNKINENKNIIKNQIKDHMQQDHETTDDMSRRIQEMETTLTDTVQDNDEAIQDMADALGEATGYQADEAETVEYNGN